jgi:hypothetical protein
MKMLVKAEAGRKTGIWSGKWQVPGAWRLGREKAAWMMKRGKSRPITPVLSR